MKNAGPSRFVFWLIVAVYLLRQAAQAAITPWGESLDFFGHLAYIVYQANQGRPPSPDDLTLPAWVQRMNELVPGPDPSTDGRRYHAWAQIDPAARARIRAALNVVPADTVYSLRNYQSQHPPLYYWLLGWAWRAFPPALGLDWRVYILSGLSIALSALALPGLYRLLRLYCEPAPALLTLLAVAWYPNLLLFLSRITNDALALPLLVWGLYFSLRARGAHRSTHLIVAGILLLAALFTKTYALTFLPLYLLCAWVGEQGLRWSHLWLAAALLALGLAGLAAFNLVTTGMLIPLTEMRLTAAAPLAARIAALFQVDLFWFVGGLVWGSWWMGDWSFVSPGLWYYWPTLALAAVPVLRPRGPGARRDWFSWRALWPHYAAVVLFVAGMLWHAALFTLDARLTGQSRRAGNEGWYADVLLGSVAVILIVLLQRRLSDRGLVRLLAGVTIFFIVWSWLGQVTLFMYWGGMVTVRGLERGVRWEQFIPALCNQQAWANWLSLPGILHPVLLTFVLPQLLALASTTAVLWRLAHRAPSNTYV